MVGAVLESKRICFIFSSICRYYNRKSNPNAYYYRFNDPGVPQATGAWSAEEKKKFMNLIKEGVDYQVFFFFLSLFLLVGHFFYVYSWPCWLSMLQFLPVSSLPLYYTNSLLVNDGEIIDDNYVYDEKKGKYKFQFRDKDGKCIS